MQIIDGYTGYGHVMSTQVAMYNEGTFGPGDCVLPVGTKFQATKITNNQVRIGDGCGQINGIRYVIESGQVENVVIENGAAGAYRKDLIVCRYVKDDTSNVESTTLAVIKGTPGTSSSYADPSYQTGSIIGGAFVREMPLWRAVIEGTTLVRLEKMYRETPTISNIWKTIYPVGAIYISTTNTSPASFLGGTWESFGAGRTLVGVDPSDTDFNASNKTGGAKTHTLTRDEMPSHQHLFNTAAVGAAFVSGTARNVISGSAQNVSVSSSGGGESHNNMQPYITVYFWRRTA